MKELKRDSQQDEEVFFEQQLQLDHIFANLRACFLENWRVSNEEPSYFQTPEWQQFFHTTAELLLQLAAGFQASGQAEMCFRTAEFAFHIGAQEEQVLRLLRPFYEARGNLRVLKPLRRLLEENKPASYEEQLRYFHEKVQGPLWALG
ncbi:hypothetical protein [Ectobacillus ponti]|uniref:Uncharacterized protein n=1 Tax=Ectobacillus ponti TaxID=2961894 RepID=A0AA41X6Y3_9BACI|nr:hypothetical protein [Ectobacillus ponti]MCP8968328.1 hypothetical protein [Ectobacillus ponti]